MRTPAEQLEWLARIAQGADVSLIVVNQAGRLHWTLHAEGLPQHVGVLHVEAATAEECAKLAQLELAAAVVKRLKSRAESREQRCPFWTKKRYGGEDEAQAALVVLARTHEPGDHIPTHAYYCDPQGKPRGCGWYHLTSHPGAQAIGMSA